MRVIIQVIKRVTDDEESLRLKKMVQAAVKDVDGIEVTMNTIG